jgi:hypothetical protein
MSLARVKVWIPGDVLTAADLNGEFNNIINNPITLISPSTGAINFNLQAHTNLLPSVITATGGSAGQALISTGGTTVSFGTPSVGSASLTGFTSGDTPVGTSSGALSAVSIGSTGKVYAVTSSNSPPAWQVIPPDGGLSTTVPSTGMVYYISTSGVLKGLTAGTSGQVLTLSTNIVPTWAASAAAQFSQEFISTSTAAISLSAISTFAHGLTTTPKLVQVSMINTSSELSYSVGDEVLMPGGNSFSAAGNLVVWDGTNINVISGSAIAVLNKTTFASANINATRWYWKVKAWA